MSQTVEELAVIETIKSVFLGVNKLSLTLASILSLFIFCTTWLFKFNSTKRLSYRLYFWLSIADILTHFPLLINYKDKVKCNIVNFIVTFANVWTVMITTVMALNLHLVFILAKPNLVRSEKFYVLTCFLVSFLICVPIAVVNGIYPNTCPYYTQFNPPYDIVVLFALFAIWTTIPTIYCFYVFIRIAMKLSDSKTSSVNGSSFTEDQRNQRMLLKRMVARLVLYPLVPVITVFPYIISVVAQDSERTFKIHDALLQYFAATTQGTFNFLFFMFDPALPALFKEIKLWFNSFSIIESTQTVKKLDDEHEVRGSQDRISLETSHKAHSPRSDISLSSNQSQIGIVNEDIELISCNSTSNNYNTKLTANPRLLV